LRKNLYGGEKQLEASMYNDSPKDWLGSLVVAGLGAGVITSFSVSQGQNPLVGLGITAIAAIAAVTIDTLL
jgi:hypothetical protein